MILTILYVLFSIGFLIFIHELGHFLAAKKVGIKVERFSIGFGPKLIGKKWGDTEYQISWLPLFGGYVKMPGENPNEQTGEEGEFSSASVPRRFAVVIAGPAMNFLLAVLIFYGLFIVGVPEPIKTTQIGYVEPSSPADKSGLQPGDKIISINRYKVNSWDDIRENIGPHAGQKLTLMVERSGQIMNIAVTPEEKVEPSLGKIGKIGIAPPVELVVGAIEKGSKASKADIKPKDKIVAVNHKAVNQANLIDEIQASHKKDIVLTVERENKNIDLKFDPEFDSAGKLASWGGLFFQNPTKMEKYNPLLAWPKAFQESLIMVKKTVITLKKLISREISPKHLAGPIGIVQLSVTATKVGGIMGLLSFMALVSVNLCIVNLLPIPIADGGLVVLLGIESLYGKPLSVKKQVIIQQVGIWFVILLFLMVTGNDIMRLVNLYLVR